MIAKCTIDWIMKSFCSGQHSRITMSPADVRVVTYIPNVWFYTCI